MIDDDLELNLPELPGVVPLPARPNEWNHIVQAASARRRRRHLVIVGAIPGVVAILAVLAVAAVIALRQPQAHEPTSTLATTPEPTGTASSLRSTQPWPGLPADAVSLPGLTLSSGSRQAVVIVNHATKVPITEAQARAAFEANRAGDGLPPKNTSDELVEMYSRGAWVGEPGTTPADRFHSVGLYWLIWMSIPPADVLGHPAGTKGPCTYLITISATTGKPAGTEEYCTAPAPHG